MWNRSNKILSTILAFCLSLAVFCTQAESSVAQIDGAQVDVKRPYSGQQGRMIKALSSKEVQGLLQGKGMGMAKAAELNQYPGPRHVLDLAQPLKLSSEQINAAQALFDAMKQQAVILGKQVVALEKELDRLFASGQITELALNQQLKAIANTRARLRGVHLQTHLNMRSLLTEEQIRQYVQLRGYDKDRHGYDGSSAHQHHH